MIAKAANPNSLKSPSDTVSDMQFVMTPANKLLLGCCSWDGMVIIYEVDQNIVAKPVFEHKSKDKVAYLRFCFQPDGSSCFVASSNHQIIQINISSKAETVIGSHADRIVGLRWCAGTNQLISCSVDKTLQLWDVAQKKSVKTLKLDKKPTYMSCNGATVAVSTINPPAVLIGTSNLDKLQEVQCTRESTPTCVDVFQVDQTYYYIAGYLYGNVEIGSSKNPESLMFEPHRNDPASTAYAVNHVSIFQTIGASCGGDGKVHIFDFNNGQDVKTIDIAQSKPVVCVAVAPVPNVIAAATGRDWSKGTNDTTKYLEQVYIQKI